MPERSPRRPLLRPPNKQGWTRIGILFACTFLGHFALTMSRLSTSTNNNTTNNNNNPLLRGADDATVGQLRSERRKFELFGLENKSEREKFELFRLESNDEQSANSQHQPPLKPTTERKKFELFSLPESEMRPELPALPEQYPTTSPTTTSTMANAANATVELALFATPNCQLSTNDTDDTQVHRVQSDGPEPLPFVPSTAFLPQSGRVQGNGVVEVHAGSSSSQPFAYQPRLTAAEGCVDLHKYFVAHKTVQFTLHASASSSTPERRFFRFDSISLESTTTR